MRIENLQIEIKEIEKNFDRNIAIPIMDGKLDQHNQNVVNAGAAMNIARNALFSEIEGINTQLKTIYNENSKLK